MGIILAEKEGFEPSHRLPQPTPLAGEPLQPYLGTSPKISASLIILETKFNVNEKTPIKFISQYFFCQVKIRDNFIYYILLYKIYYITYFKNIWYLSFLQIALISSLIFSMSFSVSESSPS